MKLYIEEQVRNAYNAGVKLAMEWGYDKELDGGVKHFEEKFINSLTPIELPTNDEIDSEIDSDIENSKEYMKYNEKERILMKAAVKAGAKWVIKHIITSLINKQP